MERLSRVNLQHVVSMVVELHMLFRVISHDTEVSYIDLSTAFIQYGFLELKANEMFILLCNWWLHMMPNYKCMH